MRYLRFLPVFFLGFFLTSCEGDVRFTTDQPNGMPVLREVPSSLQGDYVSNSDSLYVRVNSMLLVRPSRTSIPLADSSKVGLYKMKDGKYGFRMGSDRYVERITKDSVTIVNRNTQLYKLGKDTVLKNFNDAYWLSMKSKDEWKVMKIELRKKKLSIAVPSLPKDEKQRMHARFDASKNNIDTAGTFSVVVPFRRSADKTYFIVDATPDNLKNLDRRGLFRPVANFEKVK